MKYLIGVGLGFILANLVIIAFASYEKNFWEELKKQYRKHFILLVILPILEGISLLFKGYTFEIQLVFFLLSLGIDKIIYLIFERICDK